MKSYLKRKLIRLRYENQKAKIEIQKFRIENQKARKRLEITLFWAMIIVVFVYIVSVCLIILH